MYLSLWVRERRTSCNDSYLNHIRTILPLLFGSIDLPWGRGYNDFVVKVTLKITPSLAWLADARNSDWVTLEKEMPEDATIADLVQNLTSNSAGFRRMLIDPETGKMSEQIELILNQSLIQFSRDMETTRLKNGDTVTLLPVYAGG